MNLIIDPDIKAVLEFMQSNIAANKLLGVADNLPSLAKILWSHHRQESVIGLSLSPEPFSSSDEKQSAAT